MVLDCRWVFKEPALSQSNSNESFGLQENLIRPRIFVLDQAGAIIEALKMDRLVQTRITDNGFNVTDIEEDGSEISSREDLHGNNGTI